MEEPSFNLVEAFITVAKRHSFAKAAQDLKMTPSSVSRLIKSLEEQLGVRLINRTTRAMSLTDAGQIFFQDSSAALDHLLEAYKRVRNEQDVLSGTLKLSMSVAFGRAHVLPHLSDFMSAHPQLRLDLLMTDRYVDIVAEGVSLALRIGSLQDSTLIARKILSNRRILVAAPSYLERCGTPARVDDLKQHQCLISSAKLDGELWRLHGDSGERAFRPNGRIRADNGDATYQFAVAGQGIAFHSEVTMAQSLYVGQLVQVLPQWTGRETGLYCVFPSRPFGHAAQLLTDYLASCWRETECLSARNLHHI